MASTPTPQEEPPAEVEELHHEAGEFLRKTSNIERMEAAAASYTRKALTLMSAQDPNAIERDLLRQVIRLQRERFYGCLSLPFSIAFFFFFAFSSLLHEDITNVFVVQAGLNSQLLNNFVKTFDAPSDTPESISEIWNWLNSTFMPTLFSQADLEQNSYTDKLDWGRVLSYSKVHGPVIFEQMRSDTGKCTTYPGFWTDMTCFPFTTKNKQTFGRAIPNNQLPLYIAQPQPGEYAGGNATWDQRRAFYDSSFSVPGGRKLRSFANSETDRAFASVNAVAGDDTFAVNFNPNTPYHLIQEHLNYLVRREWLDSQTKQLKVKALMLNAEWGRARLQQYLLYFGFSRQGGVFVVWQLETLFLDFFSGGLSVLVDILWVLTLLVSVGIEAKNVRKAKKEGQLCKMLKKPWTILQWTIIVGGAVIIGLYAIQNFLRTDVVTKLEAVVKTQLADLPPEINTVDSGTALHNQADWMTYMTQWQRIIVGWYHLLLMIRFFFAFSNQPRLAVVTSTLEVALIDMVHFLIVLLPTFIAYAISGMFIFGRRMNRFSNPSAAIGSCFRIMMENQYDWSDLSERDWWTAGFWVWSFTILLMMLMVNMILAIVLDVYTEMRRKSGQSEAVWVTLTNICLQVWHRRVWVSNKALRDGIRMLPRKVTREELLKVFPSMSEAQLGILVAACRYQNEVQSANSRSAISESMKMAMAAKLVVDKVSEAVDELHQGKVTGSVSTAEAEDWIGDIAKELATQNHLMLSVQWQLQQLEWQWKAIEGVHGKGITFDSKAERPPIVEPEVL